MSQFVDEVTIKVRSGDGGNGIIAWRREKYEPLGGPAGGTGGRGGDVVLEASDDLSTLLDFRYQNEFNADNGERGGPKNKSGKAGKELLIKVPIGTIVTDKDTGAVIADLSANGARALVAEGGRGGRGNAALATQAKRAPHYCEPGELGIERNLLLTLKLLADVGLVGLPNAGKSSLLAVLTAARPKIADYPFSTLSPNLGVMRRPDGDGIVLADIPGLIEGASAGAGLGHTFLRHIERTRLLVHIVDLSSASMAQDISTIVTELKTYAPQLAQMKRIVFLNKTDLLPAEQIPAKAEEARQALQTAKIAGESIVKIVSGSCATTESIAEIRNLIWENVSKREQSSPVFVMDDSRAFQHPGDFFEVHRRKNIFYVSGPRLERIVGVTDLRSPESLQHLFHVLRSMGVIEALLSEGIKEGSEVVIGKTSFAYGEDFF